MLIKGDFPMLQKLNLSNYFNSEAQCELANEGAKQLSKGCWPKLTSLHIGILLVI